MTATDSSQGGERAALIEVFASIQGEGRFVGEPMTFLRVATCPLRCHYCDTPNSYQATADFVATNGVEERRHANPVTVDQALELIDFAATGAFRSRVVSVTGGEPLAYPGFVAALGRQLRQRAWRMHLETAAHDPVAFEGCVFEVDHLSADLKLPVTLNGAAGHPTDVVAENLACVRQALAARCSVDLKVVLTPELAADLAPLRQAIKTLLAMSTLATSSGLQLILQPVTPIKPGDRSVSGAQIAAAVADCTAAGLAPRVIPQVHRAMLLP